MRAVQNKYYLALACQCIDAVTKLTEKKENFYNDLAAPATNVTNSSVTTSAIIMNSNDDDYTSFNTKWLTRYINCS